jgi:hypothetical protein
MNKQEILQIAKQDPRFAQAILTVENQMGDTDITPEQLAELVKMLEFALNNPNQYPQIRDAIVKDGLAPAEDLPEQFNPVVLISVLVLLYGLQERSTQKMARGGLASAARQMRMAGRNGDTMLAHINPREARMLKQAGGSGTINPSTGLPEYFDIGDFFKLVLPIALNFIAPTLGSTIGAALGASATWAPALGGALIGAGTSAITGGNPLQGAIMGGMGGGLGGNLGQMFAPDASAATQGLLGSGLAGAVGGMASGRGPLEGAVQGALGSYIGNAVGGMGGSGAVGTGLAAGSENFRNAMVAGYDPQTALTSGALSGLAAGMRKPSQTAIDSLGSPTTKADAKSGFSFDKLGNLLPFAGLLSSGSSDAQQAVKSMSPEQQEYFNRPSIKWDWPKMQRDASNANMSLSQFMAQNWPQVTSGTYNLPVVTKARGGPLSQIAYMARGSGSGRDDTIDARLSDGEYVIDAETVALLGDGSSKMGAQRLDLMREQIRKQKGKALVRGKFSPDAKSPLSYLRGA